MEQIPLAAGLIALIIVIGAFIWNYITEVIWFFKMLVAAIRNQPEKEQGEEDDDAGVV